jgi:hypothetical protein
MMLSSPKAPPPPGWWSPTEPPVDRERLQLEVLGYAGATERAPVEDGVRLLAPDRMQPGLNLYHAGHAPEAYVVDVHGDVEHTWSASLHDIWPGMPTLDGVRTHQYWRRVHLRPDGGLYVVFSHYGVARLSADSTVVWKTAGWPHHDIVVAPDGTVLTLCKIEGVDPLIDPEQAVHKDCVQWLSESDGSVIRTLDIYQAIRDSSYAALLDRPVPTIDLLHANSLVVLDGSAGPPFERGHLMVSLREIDTAVVIDPQRNQVVWALTGMWRHQHDTHLTPAGTLLAFDNGHGVEQSRIVDIDPRTQRIVWTWGEHDDFYSRVLGATHRLPNGNTLAIESTRGRALEIAPDGDVVWEFVHPHRGGEDGELIAAMFDLERLETTTWPPQEPDGRPAKSAPGTPLPALAMPRGLAGAPRRPGGHR